MASPSIPPHFPLPHIVTSAHPYVVQGDKQPMHYEQKDGTYYARVDLPGVCKEMVRVWIDKDFLFFEGEDPKNDEEYDKESPRKFKGQIALSTRCCYKTDEMKFVMKDGVLKVKIPYKDD